MPENFLEEMRFFLPSSRLTKELFVAIEVVRRSDQIRAREDREQTEDVNDEYLNYRPPVETDIDAAALSAPAPEHEEMLGQRRFIAEELYHHLAFVSRSPPAKNPRPLHIREVVTHGMANALGLPQEEPLLSELAGEFIGWLSEQGEFITGWGKIILAEGDSFYLQEIPTPERDTPSERVFIPRPSRPRAGQRRSVGGGGKAG
jgi:hypothetical protein